MYLYKGPEEIINEVIESNKENYDAWLGLMILEDNLVKFEVDNTLSLLEIEEIKFSGYENEFNELSEIVSAVLNTSAEKTIYSEKSFISLMNMLKDLGVGMNQ